MVESWKSHSRIDIVKPSPSAGAQLAFNVVQDQRIPFFKSAARRGGDTWVISVFVILHLLAFIATMVINDCWTNSHEDCAFKALGRFSFQPLSENPLLGPSASTLDEMGSLRRVFLTENHQTWRLFTFPILHGGAIHLVINIFSVIFVGIHLEQEFGPFRIGTIYILSSFLGALVAALFIQNTPGVGASGALYGLLGAMLSALARNWKSYTNKVVALASLLLIFVLNFLLGLLPYVDNFSCIGGFISGFLLGFVLLFNPEPRQIVPSKVVFFENDVKSSIKSKLKEKMDRPILRSVSLLIFILLLAGCLVAVLHGTDINRYCGWCAYVDCIPSKRWHCKNIAPSCEKIVNDAQLTLTCLSNGNFRIFPYTNVSERRMDDLCNLLC